MRYLVYRIPKYANEDATSIERNHRACKTARAETDVTQNLIWLALSAHWLSIPCRAGILKLVKNATITKEDCDAIEQAHRYIVQLGSSQDLLANIDSRTWLN
jgi:hypothetical protein